MFDHGRDDCSFHHNVLPAPEHLVPPDWCGCGDWLRGRCPQVARSTCVCWPLESNPVKHGSELVLLVVVVVVIAVVPLIVVPLIVVLLLALLLLAVLMIFVVLMVLFVVVVLIVLLIILIVVI